MSIPSNNRLSLTAWVFVAWASVSPLTAATFLQVVNATSVEKISLSLDGQMAYPVFAQGEWTGSFSLDQLTPRWVAVDLDGGRKKDSGPVKYDTGASQMFVIMGDFSTDSPPDTLPQPGPPADPPVSYPPNVQFRVYPSGSQEGEMGLRYRFVNAMPRTPLQIQGPGLPLTTILPGDDVAVTGQSKIAAYQVTIAGVTEPLPLSQTKTNHNRFIVFYLKAGKPTHLALVEGPGK